MSARDDWRELADLDATLLGEITDLVAAGPLLDQRSELLRKIAAETVSTDDLDELDARNRRLTEWLLHWRRVALIEATALDQHLRFLSVARELPGDPASLEVLG